MILFKDIYPCMDIPTQNLIALLHPKLRIEAENLINQANAALQTFDQVRIVQTLRTFAQQNALYAQGRQIPGHVVTNAKGGQSLHNYGLAFDFCLLTKEGISWDIHADFDKDGVADWAEVVNIFKSNGWVWGGQFKSIPDNPHLQKTFGHTWSDLLVKYNAGETFIDKNGQKYVIL